MSTKTFVYEGEGYKFTVSLELVDKLDDEGKPILDAEGGFVQVVQMTVTSQEGYADINLATWLSTEGQADDAPPPTKGPLNMNGEGSLDAEGNPVSWTDHQKLSDPGLKGLGTDKPTVVTMDKPLVLELPAMSVEEFNTLQYFGIRATSVNDEGSIKGVAPPYEPPPEECTDFFPDMDKGISHVTFVWSYDEKTASDELKALDTNGDGYITVKIDIPGGTDDEPFDLGECGNDLDKWYKAALADIYEDEELGVLQGATLEGAYIKSGAGAFSGDDVWTGTPGAALDSLAYFSVEDVEGNDNGNDPRPDGMGTEVEGSRGNPSDPTTFTQLTDYTDGNTFGFNEGWIPDECECIA